MTQSYSSATEAEHMFFWSTLSQKCCKNLLARRLKPSCAYLWYSGCLLGEVSLATDWSMGEGGMVWSMGEGGMVWGRNGAGDGQIKMGAGLMKLYWFAPYQTHLPWPYLPA